MLDRRGIGDDQLIEQAADVAGRCVDANHVQHEGGEGGDRRRLRPPAAVACIGQQLLDKGDRRESQDPSRIELARVGPPPGNGIGDGRDAPLQHARHVEQVSLPRALGLAHLMPLYTYMWYVAAWRALTRMVLRRRVWAKTARLAEPSASPTSVTVSPDLGRHRRKQEVAS